jgi:hypothetical protein
MSSATAAKPQDQPQLNRFIGERPEQSGLFSGLSFASLRKATGWVPDTELSKSESESTLFRFFRSKHVRDLKLICAIALIVFLSHLALVLLIGLLDALNVFFFPPADEPWGLRGRGVSAISEFVSFLFKYIGPAVPIYGLIMGWAYQSASKRLGIVDLFACEIGTLCRVGTIFDIGRRYVEEYDRRPSQKTSSSGSFVSKEEYFPVFDNNSRDLQLLEASVVNHITEFYTYMKGARDAQRRLAETKASEGTEANAQSRSATLDAAWHTAIVSVIYLIYLGYESARNAINDLVEYQPARAERLIVVLLTELKCFSFLRNHFTPEDLRWRRLQLREADYRQQVLDVYDEVMLAPHGHNAKDWLQAEKTIPDLVSRYHEALGEDLVAACKARADARNARLDRR